MSNEHSMEMLEEARNAGYGPQPVPAPRDRDIEALLHAELSSGRIDVLRSLVDARHEATLRAFAERMATLAVREGSGRPVELGLVALSLAGLDRGARESVMVLALLFDAVKRTGASPDEVLSGTAARLGDGTRAAMHAFLARSEADKSLEAMGFRLAADADGPRYVTSW